MKGEKNALENIHSCRQVDWTDWMLLKDEIGIEKKGFRQIS